MSESLQEFYDRHKDFVYSYILCAFGGNTREAKQLLVDLFREFFAKIEKNPKNLDDETLHSLLRRRTRTYIREHEKRLRDMAPPSSYQTRLQKAIGSLPQLQQDCVLFKYIYGFSPRELSKGLDKTEASIRQNLSRGTKRIFDLMEEEDLDSRSFRIPIAQIPNSAEQKLKSTLNPRSHSVDLSFLDAFKHIFQKISFFASKRKLLSVGIILLISGAILELPKLVYQQDWIVPGNHLYTWKKNMELKNLEKLRHPANLANFYLSLSNRRIKEAYILSQERSLAARLFPMSFAQNDQRHFPTITFDINTQISPQSGLVAESGLMVQRAIEYASNIDQPTTLITVLQNIKHTLEAQQAYLTEIQKFSHEPAITQLTTSLQLIHQLNIKVIELAGQQVAEQALATETEIDPLSPVPIKILLQKSDNNSIGPVAESIRIHQQFRPMIRPQDESIESFADAVLEIEPHMIPIKVNRFATIESLMAKIESLHFPEKAKASAEKEKKETEEPLFENTSEKTTKKKTSKVTPIKKTEEQSEIKMEKQKGGMANETINKKQPTPEQLRDKMEEMREKREKALLNFQEQTKAILILESAMKKESEN